MAKSAIFYLFSILSALALTYSSFAAVQLGTVGSPNLENRFKQFINAMSLEDAKEALKARDIHLSVGKDDFLNNLTIAKNLNMGLDNLSKALLQTEEKNLETRFSPQAKQAFLYAFAFGDNNDLQNMAAAAIYRMAAFAKICGDGNVYKFNAQANTRCENAKLTDYRDRFGKMLEVTTYGLFNTILKNADELNMQNFQTPAFVSIIRGLAKGICEASKIRCSICYGL